MRLEAALAFAVVGAVVAAAPALAASSMMSSSQMIASARSMMMKPGESLLIMPNGDTKMLPAMQAPMDPSLMKAAMPIEKCTILMMGADGKMYMVGDMKLDDGSMACDQMKGKE
jgi:hypothetical protein